MPKREKKNSTLTKTHDIEFGKIRVFFKRSILKAIMKILTMEHDGFRTYKSVKNINRLFTSIDPELYKNNTELLSYIWCICYISKHWIDGVVHIEVIAEMAKRHPDYDNIKGDIIDEAINDKRIISTPEAKAVLDLVSEALQWGFITSIKDEYINLLDDIDIEKPGAFRELVNRLFLVSQSVLDIKHNTNMVSNKVTFNSGDIESIKNAIGQTINSLTGSGSVLKTGIRRLNTLLSPGYMNGRLYTYIGLPGTFKSGILLKSAIDIRKYNPGYKTKTPGAKPCVLYVTMENTFTETIERVWNMSFDDSITNYTIEEATERLCNELGIKLTSADDIASDQPQSLVDKLEGMDTSASKPNIEIIIKYFPYREISTDDLFTIIQDLRDENMEVCALVFDYVKRIRPSIPVADNVKMELNRIVNELKALAVIEDIPVITAHQMNRAAAATIDAATRQGKSDVTKLVGRENIGDA